MSKDAVREKKYDFPMMPENWLSKVLKSEIKLSEKKQLLLTQLGYLRINIFTEYYERIKLARERNELDKAVELMNDHAKIARIFISTKKQPTLVKHIKNLLSIKSIEPMDFLQKWLTTYEKWITQGERDQQNVDAKKRMEEFEQLRMAFLELYTFSFSVDNFPPLRSRRSDH